MLLTLPFLDSDQYFIFKDHSWHWVV